MTTAQPLAQPARAVVTSYKDAPTRTVSAGGVDFAYRQPGPTPGVPGVFLTHLAAVWDNWDPRFVDGVAAKHRVIPCDSRGVGAASGSTPNAIDAMATDAVVFIGALGLEQVDLLGFPMGGMIAQLIAADEPAINEAAQDFRTFGAAVETVEADLATFEGVDKLYAATKG